VKLLKILISKISDSIYVLKSFISNQQKNKFMKNVITLLCLLFIVSSQLVFAQGFGIKAGVLYNDLELKNSTPNTFFTNKTEQLVGFTFGAMYQKRFNKILSLKTELGYSRKGAKFIIPSDQTIPSFKIKLDYLDLAVFGIFSVYDEISIELGAETSFLIKNDELLIGVTSNSKSNFDIGLIGGVTYLLNDKIEISTRYYYGLRNVFQFNFEDNRQGIDDGSFDFLNRNLEVSIGYFFRKNKIGKS